MTSQLYHHLISEEDREMDINTNSHWLQNQFTYEICVEATVVADLVSLKSINVIEQTNLSRFLNKFAISYVSFFDVSVMIYILGASVVVN